MMAGAAEATTQPSKGAGPREGVLTFLDNTVTNGTGTVHVRATIPNDDRYFWPGQFVKVRLVLTTMKDAVLIPSAATQIGQPAQLLVAGALLGLAAPAPATLGLVAVVACHYRSSPPSVGLAWLDRGLPRPLSDRTTVRNAASRSPRARSAPCPPGR